MKKITLLFIIACAGATLIFCFPILLRIPCLYCLISWYLSVLPTPEYKGILINTFGALYGAFMGVTGAVWAQHLATERSKTAEIEKNAQIIHDDLNDSLNWLKHIFPNENVALTLADAQSPGNRTSQDFLHRITENHLFVLPDWKQIVLSVGCRMEADDLRLLLSAYSKMSIISDLLDQLFISSQLDNILLSKLYVLTSSFIAEKTIPDLERVNTKLDRISHGKK